MTLGELIREAADWIYGMWPMRIVQDWEQGIRVRHGNVTALLTSTNGLFKTGIHFFWPFIGEVITEEANVRVVETDFQTCVTKDGKDATFSLGIKYKIRDLKAMYLKIHEHGDTVNEEIRSSAGTIVPDMNFANMPRQLGDAVAERARQRMRGWGVELVAVSLVNLTAAQPFRLIFDSGSRSGE